MNQSPNSKGFILFTLFALIASFNVSAEITVPDTVRDQIVIDVMSEQGYYNAAEIEQRIRLWQLEQPQPRASGELTDSGSCSPTCEQTGGDVNLPKPRDVKFKGKIKDGKFTQNLIIKWKRPQNLPEGSSFKLKHYKIILSKDGATYEKYKVKAKFKNNGNPKKHQKLKLRGLELGEYEVQVRAFYKTINNTTAAKSGSLKDSLNRLTGVSQSSLWTDTKGGGSKPDPTKVSELSGSSALYICLQDQTNTPNETVDGNTLLTNITHIKCVEEGLVDSDIQLLSLFDGLILLDIKKNNAVTNISPLGDISQLSWLNLNWNHSIDLAPLADETKFSSLDSLYISWMGLTQIPEFPESVTYLSIVGNLISDNSGGYYPDFPLDVIDASNNKQSLDANNEPTGDLVLNDQFITNLVTNDFAVKTFKARHTVLTNLSLLAGIDGLENLEIRNGNLNSSQNLGSFSGFCSLSINSDQMVKLKKKRPVQFLDLTDNPVLKNADLLRKDRIEDGVYHDYQPLQSNMTGSDALKCEVYYQAEDNNETPLQDMSSVPSFNLPNGEKAEVLNCPILTIPPALTNAEYCKPNEVSNTVSVYQDLDSSRRFVTWEKASSHDYARWGVTLFKISTYEGPQLLNVHYQSSDQPWVFVDSNTQPDNYVIQACTENVCGYERSSNPAFKVGLARVTDITQQWNSDGSEVTFEFKYPDIFNPTDEKGKPDYFKVKPVFTQPSGTAEIPNIDVVSYESSWSSTAIVVDQFVGSSYEIQACRIDIGCGVETVVYLTRPTGNTTISPLQNVTANSLNNDIVLTWDVNALDQNADYIEIVERQPKIRKGHKALLGQVATDGTTYEEIRFYTDKLDAPLKLERIVNGDYEFTLRACLRDRENSDVCSDSVIASTQINMISSDDYPNAVSNLQNSGDLAIKRHVYTSVLNGFWAGASSQEFSYDHRYSYSIDLKNGNFPNTNRPADYFYLERIEGPNYCVQKYQNPDYDPDNGIYTEYMFEKLTSFSVENDYLGYYKNSGKSCQFNRRSGTWAVSACFEGIGCGDAITINLADGQTQSLDISNTAITDVDYIESALSYQQEQDVLLNSSGPGDVEPGLYWNFRQSGTGWQFHWATHVNGRADSPSDFRVAYDLVAYWFAYSKKQTFDNNQSNYIWTPTWYKAELKESSTTPGYYEGDFKSFKKENGIVQEVPIGALKINLESDIPDDNKMILEMHLSGKSASTMRGTNDFSVPCYVDDNGDMGGSCTFELENFSILGVDGGADGDIIPPGGERFGYGNNSDHYSGVWSYGWDDNNSTSETTIITTIRRGLEVSWVATFDIDGAPIWAVSQSCGEDCNRSDGSYFTDYLSNGDFGKNIYSIRKGFNPLKYTPERFWDDVTSNPKMVGKLGRCFNAENIQTGQSDFNLGQFYLDIDIDDDNVSLREADFTIGSETGLADGTNCDTIQSGLAPLEKVAGEHYLGFEINEGNDVSNGNAAICDPNELNGLGTCIIEFDWYTGGNFPDIEAFYSKNGGVLKPFSSVEFCENIDTAPSGLVVKDFICEIKNVNVSESDDTYNFVLRKPQYNSDTSWETIAESPDLVIQACPNGAAQCTNNVQASTPKVIDVDPPVVGSMDGIMDHYPGDGLVPGSGGVSGGTATYDLPIVIPPGRNGMMPNVSINYSSKGGSGSMGVGWSVSAGSGISRCPKTWAQDGESRSVDLTSNDRLCLDGQRLIETSSKDYWEHNSEYRTEIDTFVKVKYNSVSNTFTVLTKAGRENTYRQLGNGQTTTWYLTEEKDSYGNNIRYTYGTSYGNNETLLNNIVYTGHNTGLGDRSIQFIYESRESGNEVFYNNGIKSELTKQLSSITTHVPADTKHRQYDFGYRTSESDGNLLLQNVNETAFVDKNDTTGVTRNLIAVEWTDTNATINGTNVSWSGSEEDDMLFTDFSSLTDADIRKSLLNRAQLRSDFNGDGFRDYLTISTDGEKKKMLFFEQDSNKQLQFIKGLDLGEHWRFPNDMGGADFNQDGVTDLLIMRKSTCNISDGEQLHLEVLSWDNDNTIDNTLGSSYTNYTNSEVLCDIDLRYDTSQPYSDNNRIDVNRSKFFMNDFNGDGKSDIFFIKNPLIGSSEETCWPGQTISCSDDKTLVSYHENTTVCTNETNCNDIKFSSGVQILELLPFGDTEAEADIWFYIWDHIDDFTDLNGDGYPDFRVTRWVSAALFQAENFRRSAVENRVYFTGKDSQGNITVSDAIDYDTLGLNQFQCETLVDNVVTPTACNYSMNLVNHHANSFVDINGDGLLDYLYYDRGKEFVKKWKVRLNTGDLIVTDTTNNGISGELFSTETYTADLDDSATQIANDMFLPGANACDNPDTPELHRICNPYFRATTEFADMDADGVAELLFPEPDPTKLPFNYCSRFSETDVQVDNNKVLAKNLNPTINSDFAKKHSEFVLLVDSNDVTIVNGQPAIPEIENEIYNPSLNPINDEIDFTPDEANDFFDSFAPGVDITGSMPYDFDPQRLILGNTVATGCGYSNTPGVRDLYEDYGGINVLHDDSVYRFNSIKFELGNDFKLNLKLNSNTGIYKPLRSGAIGDLSGDSIVDASNRVGCVKGTDDVCLDTSVADASDWGEFGANITDGNNDGSNDDELLALLTASDWSGLSLINRLNRPMPNLISRVDKANTGEWVEWDHLPISDNNSLYNIFERGNSSYDGYIDEAGATGSHIYFRSNMYVVPEMRQSNGFFSTAGAESHDKTTYAYREAVFNTQGRGFQGFRKIQMEHFPNVDNLENKTKSTSIFNQVFPIAGNVAEIRTNKYINGDKQLQTQSYAWSFGNLSESKGYDVHYHPVTEVVSTVYKDDASNVYSTTTQTYDASNCDSTTKAYDGYGNELCMQEVQVDTIDVEEGFTDQKIISTHTVITESIYETANTSDWWIDKLKTTHVSSTISEGGDYLKPLGYSSAGLDKNVNTRFFWQSGELRKLDCQFTYDDSVTEPSSCATDPASSQVVKTAFTYDVTPGYGNITRVDTIGRSEFGTISPVTTRSASSSYDQQGYFVTAVNNEGIFSYMSHDKATGQIISQENADGVISENVFDVFNQAVGQSTFVELGGEDIDELNQPIQSATVNCLLLPVSNFTCSSAQGLVVNLMNSIKTKTDSLSLTNPYSGLIFDDAVQVPKLTYVKETRQLGGALVRQWLDQNGQVVLTRTRHSDTANTAQNTYVLNLANQLGQTEISTEPFKVNDSSNTWSVDGSTPYVTYNLYDHRGRQVEKHNEVGQLSDTLGNCWRKTLYDHDGGKTSVMASYSGSACLNTAENNLSMVRSLDSKGRLRYTKDAMGYQTEYWYDSASNPYMVVDAADPTPATPQGTDGNIIVTQHDDLGRKLSVVDPNMGLKSFSYNSFGEVVREQDAEQAANSLANYTYYDDLGRVIHKYSNVTSHTYLNPGSTDMAYHDQFDYCVGRNYLCASFRYTNESGSGLATSFETVPVHGANYYYDEFGRVSSEDTLISSDVVGYTSVNFNTAYTYYDDHNFLKQTIYTGDREIGYSLLNHYNVFGQMVKQTENTGQTALVDMPEMISYDSWNLKGQPESYILNSDPNMSTSYSYFASTGQVSEISHDSSFDGQTFNYSYDPWGNIATQSLTNGANPSGLTETFNYDRLQRLDDSKVDGLSLINYDYDRLGNLTIKSDFASSQVYGAGLAGPNAITRSNLEGSSDYLTYHYDLKGNRTQVKNNGSAEKASYKYDANNLLTYSRLDDGNQEVAFRYGQNNQRFLKVEDSLDPHNAELREVTFYGSPAFELIINESTGEVESKFHVTNYLTVTRKDSRALKRHFLQKDRLGSITRILDGLGSTVQTKGYDAFGKPRNGDTWQAPSFGPKLNFEDISETQNGTQTTDITKRGFTNHEHLDAFELVHMNGRMYDFNNGRFLSVDPFIQGVTSQAINPYSYIQNNPLSGTDPTGYASVCDRNKEENCNKQRRKRGNFIKSRSDVNWNRYNNGIASVTFTYNKKTGEITEIESETNSGRKTKHDGVTFLADGNLSFMNNTQVALYVIARDNLSGKFNAFDDSNDDKNGMFTGMYTILEKYPDKHGTVHNLLGGRVQIAMWGSKTAELNEESLTLIRTSLETIDGHHSDHNFPGLVGSGNELFAKLSKNNPLKILVNTSGAIAELYGVITLDLNDARYFKDYNSDRKWIRSSLTRIILHESIHAILGFRDNPATNRTVHLTDLIMKDINRTKRLKHSNGSTWCWSCD